MPLDPAGDSAYLARHHDSVQALLRQGHLLQAADGGELYSLRLRPQRLVNLRGSGETFAIVDGQGKPIGTIDGVRVLHECHPGAVYLHAGRQFLVEALEREERRVRAQAAELEYFTTPLTEKQTEIREVLRRRAAGPLAVRLGRLKVTEWVVGFERKRTFGQETIDRSALDLPPVEFETVGLWWEVPRALEETLRRSGEHYLGSLHAAEHAAISLLPLLALCDRGDIGGISYPFHTEVGCGAVFIYDGHPGGVGIAERGFEELELLLSRVLALIGACGCEKGCPSCVQSPKCGNGNRPLDKAGAAHLLRLLLGLEEPLPAPSPAAAAEEIAPDQEGLLARASPAATSPVAPAVDPSSRWAVSPPAPLEAPSPPSLSPEELVPPEFLVRPELRARPAVAERSEVVAAGRHPAGVDARHSPSSPRSLSVPAGRARWPSSLRPPSDLDFEPRPAAERESEPRRRRAEVLFAAAPPPALRLGERHGANPCTVLFDLETLRSAAEVGGFGQCHRMGVAIGVACFLEEGRFEIYAEPQVPALARALRQATLVVGFNVKRFDYRVLAAYTGEDFSCSLPTLDLLEEVRARLGFRVGMGHLAQETLGLAKSADGLQSLEWVRQGRLDLVTDYCRHHVEILRDLYLHGRRERSLLYRDRRRDVRLRVPVEW
ncbi:MAG TPA: Zn-binding domain-containing protein [Thermoanaerobaculia bacterium]|nr:Zn-binding domain-containing protein [Thermoanaerobaculia bacterium]